MPSSDEVDQHGVELAEGRTGQPGAAQQGVYRAIDLRATRSMAPGSRRSSSSVRSTRHRHVFDVERRHLRTQVDENLRRGLSHPRRRPRDDHRLPCVAQHVIHLVVPFPDVGCEGDLSARGKSDEAVAAPARRVHIGAAGATPGP